MEKSSPKHNSLAGVVAATIFAILLLGHAGRSEAATVAVSNCNDSGPGSLRNAVAGARSGDLVDLRRLRCTIVLTRGAIEMPQQDLALVGVGTGALTITSQNRSRILSHGGTGTLRIASLSIEDGRQESETYAEGGCIHSAGNVALQHARVHQCSASAYPIPDCLGEDCSSSRGGAISASGTVRMSYSTVSDSVADNYLSTGGGIDADELRMFRSRLLRNSSQSSGGAQVRRFIALGSIIADNNAGFGVGGVDVSYQPSVPGSGAADVRDTTFAGNASGFFVCSALCAHDASIVNSTFTSNSGGDGAAINVFDGSIVNSTVAGNSLLSCGGAVSATTLYLESTILAGNACGTGVMDLANVGSVTGAHNLVGASEIPLPAGTLRGDPLLGPLAFNGGYTPTRALRVGSPAIDKGSNPLALKFDQRGPSFPRVKGARADIGAFER